MLHKSGFRLDINKRSSLMALTLRYGVKGELLELLVQIHESNYSMFALTEIV